MVAGIFRLAFYYPYRNTFLCMSKCTRGGVTPYGNRFAVMRVGFQGELLAIFYPFISKSIKIAWWAIILA